MPRMEDPAKRLSEIVSRIDNPRDKTHNDVPVLCPILNSEVLDCNMTRTVSGLPGVDNVDGRLVVFVEGCGKELLEAKFFHDCT